jgi:HEAT repeat protein
LESASPPESGWWALGWFSITQNIFLILRVVATVLFGLITFIVLTYVLLIATAGRRDRRKSSLRKQVVGFVMGRGELPKRQRYLRHALFEVARQLGGERRRVVAQAALERGITRHARRRLRLPGASGRAAACEMLEVLGSAEDQRALTRAASSRRSEVRIAAVRALARLELLGAELALLLLSRAGKAEALSLVEATEALGSSAVDACRAYLNGEARWRPLVAGALGRIGGNEARSVLIESLEDPDIDVVCRACNALQQFRDHEVEGALRGLLHHPAWEVRNQAARSLGKVGTGACLGDLAQALLDPAWWVRRNAAESLSTLKSGEAWLVEALWSDDRFARDTAAHALDASGTIGKLASGERARVAGRLADDVFQRLIELDKGDLVRAPLPWTLHQRSLA